MATPASYIPIMVLYMLVGINLLIKFGNAAVIYNGVNSNFDTIPSSIPLNVTYIDLKNNIIDHIPDDAFAPYTDLFQLGMSGNPLTSISTNAFRGSTLKKIIMWDIETIKYPNINPICSQLISFEFIPNSQIVIPDNYTDCMTNMKHLGLNGVTDSTLDVIGKVKGTVVKLSMARGDLSEIPVHALEGFDNLNYLMVSSNGLAYFPNLIYVSSKLTMLFLNWGGIAEVPYDMLSMLSSLQQLSLIGQQMNTIPEPLTEIESLDLKNNYLTDSLTTADWLRCRSLTSFTINSNQLTYIPDLVSMGFSEITISALDNPLNCNCALGWIITKRSDMIGRGINIKLSEYPCAAPAHLMSVPWNSMTIEQLCPVGK